MRLEDFFESTEVERLATGFQFTEGPVWTKEDYLLFSDIPGDTIYRLNPDNTHEVWRRPSGNSNGLTFDREDHLIACEHGNRRVSITLYYDETIEDLATHYQGKRLNSPNDVVVSQDNLIYFTDPPYGIQEDQRELPYNGVYCVDTDGNIQLLVDDFDRPNGLAFSPDESVLYIDDTRRCHIRAFDVASDGALTNGRVFAEMGSEGTGGADGMKVDRDGNVYCTGPGGVWVIRPNGEQVGVIRGPEQPANLAFGGDDNRNLYMTARTSVYVIRTKIPGIGPF